MNAKEAREITDKSKIGKSERSYRSLIGFMKYACEQGDNEIGPYYHADKKALECLKKDGFQIREQRKWWGGFDGIMISW